MRGRLWQEMAERLGIRRDDPSSWSWSVAKSRAIQEVLRSDAFGTLAPVVGAAVDGLFGAGTWRRPAIAPLINFPIPGASWTVPHKAWHADEPPVGSDPLPRSLAAIVFLDELEPCGGATVAIPGSLRRLQKLASEIVTTDEAPPTALHPRGARPGASGRPACPFELWTSGESLS